MEHSSMLDKSGWAKMKSPKPHLEIEEFKVNKIIVGQPNFIDRSTFLRLSKEKSSHVRIHKNLNHP
jgi:hypothetical protein